ncbi:MAG: 4Fe-4S binding protein [Thermofilaceae archaeon]
MAISLELLKNLLRRRATIMYPSERRTLPESSRGRLIFVRDLCVGCGLCWRACPSAAIEPVKDERGLRPVFYIDRCTFCYLCVEVCPRKAIKGSSEQAPVVSNRSELVVK